MIGELKAFTKRHWPALRLRTILFSVLLFAAAMPGLGAIFLRVYENALVRQTEAELIAQGAVLVAAAEAAWPGAPLAPVADGPSDGRPEPTTIDLSRSPVLPDRPAAPPARSSPDPAAVAAAAGLEPVIRRTVHTTQATILLLDGKGVVVRGDGVGGDLSGLPEVREALAGRTETVLRRNADYRPVYRFEWLSRASSIRLHHARPILAGDRVVGVLLLSRSPRALFRGIYEDRGKIAFGVVLIFSILVFLSGLISRGVTRPIEALSRASRDLAAGRPGKAPETPSMAAVEIQALYEDFAAMAAQIERRSGYLRDLAAAVSHEFKTPLAGIRGAVELLEDHFDTMTAEERRRFLANIDADSARLAQLVGRLMDLARADMATSEAGLATNVAEPVRRAADAEVRDGFEVLLELPAGMPPVAAPAAAVESVLTVLLQNARQAGASRAVVAATVADAEVVLSVTDDGPGVAPADRERLFEAFFTSRRAQGGTGLGLSIARSLLTAHHGRLELARSASGARFQATLPRA